MAKVVFILGAGASKSTGVPVMLEFLDRAHELMRESDQVSREDFERVFKVIDAFQILHAKTKTDLRNVESIFNLIEMAQLTRRLPGLPADEVEPAAVSIRRLLAQTIEQSCRFPVEEGSMLPTKSYLALATWLKNKQGHPRLFPPWVFITFNYDIALDYALFWSGLRIDYGLLERGGDSRGVGLLKLHGSLNWTECGCGNEIAVLTFDKVVVRPPRDAGNFADVP